MISPDLLERIEQLSLDEKVRLVELLKQVICERLKEGDVNLVRGLLVTDQPTPSDEEVERACIDYLAEKYR